MAMEARALPALEIVREPLDTNITDFLMRSGARIIHTREGGHVDCYIPTELIDHEEVPVKEEWAKELAAQMKKIAAAEGGTGQQAAINFGMIPGEPLLKIIDGFHRDAALAINRESIIYGAVKSTDWNGLYDQRIFDAKDHAHVRFSRVVQWIREVWEYSGLSDQMTVEQAILLYRFGTDGSKLGLDPEAVALSKEWVERKQDLWGMAAMTIHSHLKIAENVDPRLVHSTREKRRGDVLEAPTQSILKIFSENLPNQFDLQNLVMSSAMARNLKTPEIRAVTETVKYAQDYEEAALILGGLDWTKLKPAYRKTKATELRRGYDPRFKGDGSLARSASEIMGVLDRTDQIFERGDEITDDMAENLVAAQKRAEDLMKLLGRLSGRLQGLLDLRHKEASVTGLVSYLMGRSSSLPQEFSNGELRDAWAIVDASPEKPANWQTLFKHAQKPRHDRARVEERVERDLL